MVHGEAFHIDCYGLTLDSYDMLLGVQWLEALGPILWDFCHGTMAFVHNGRRVVWSVSTTVPPETMTELLVATDGELMEALLQDFAPLFREPMGLPLPRSRSHQVHLLPGTMPVAVRPYRYTHD
jgi:hypothetical protein